jgi:hypothetical protein
MIEQMASKATHIGECQVCGATQKLPGNRLSIHGYTKEHGFFNGTCHGSHGLPYEKSCDLVQASLDRAIALKTKNEAYNRELVSGVVVATGKIWYRVYSSGNGFKGSAGYYWKQVPYRVEYFGENGKYRRFIYWDPNGLNASDKRERDLPGVVDAKNSVDLENQYSREYAQRSVQVTIAQLSGYIQSQQQRLREWHERPLRPVPKAA